jgi:hypothetical protein
MESLVSYRIVLFENLNYARQIRFYKSHPPELKPRKGAAATGKVKYRATVNSIAARRHLHHEASRCVIQIGNASIPIQWLTRLVLRTRDNPNVRSCRFRVNLIGHRKQAR